MALCGSTFLLLSLVTRHYHLGPNDFHVTVFALVAVVTSGYSIWLGYIAIKRIAERRELASEDIYDSSEFEEGKELDRKRVALQAMEIEILERQNESKSP